MSEHDFVQAMMAVGSGFGFVGYIIGIMNTHALTKVEKRLKRLEAKLDATPRDQPGAVM